MTNATELSELLPGDLVYMRAHCTKRAAIAVIESVWQDIGMKHEWARVTLVTNLFDWDGEGGFFPSAGETIAVLDEALELVKA